MTTLFRKGISVLRTDGPAAFLRRAYRNMRWQLWPTERYLRWRIGSLRNVLSLSIADLEVGMVATDRQSVELTLHRFRTEREELTDFITRLRSDDVVFDIGANTGLYTCFATQKCTAGKVVAFEPYPPNIAELEANIKRNGGRGRVVEQALSDETGMANLSAPSEASPGHGTASLSEEGETVSVVRGDELVQNGTVPQPNVLKIDVEGAESRVIDGLVETLDNEACRLVYCEVHLSPGNRENGNDMREKELSAIQDRLIGLGFDVEQIGARGQEIHLRAQAHGQEH